MMSISNSQTFCRAARYTLRKRRLLIEYILLGFVLITAGGSVATFTQKEKLEFRLAGEEFKNEQQEQTINSMRNKQVDLAVIRALEQKYQKLDVRYNHLFMQMKELERNNGQVKDYLDTPLPAALGCMLPSTSSCQGNSR